MTKKAPSPVEVKVAAGASAGTLSGIVSWVLVQFVPYFHDGLPPQLATFLPMALTAVLGTAAAYLAPHTPRPAVTNPAEPAPVSGNLGASPDAAGMAGAAQALPPSFEAPGASSQE